MSIPQKPFSRNTASPGEKLWAEDASLLEELLTKSENRSEIETKQLVRRAMFQHRDKKENIFMRAFHKRPILVSIVLSLALVACVPTAYAIVDSIFLSIDPNLDDQDLEQDLRDQLEAEGVRPKEVQINREGENVTVDVEIEKEKLSPNDVEVFVDSQKKNTLIVKHSLPAEDFAAYKKMLEKTKDKENREELIQEFFRERGITEFEITVDPREKSEVIDEILREREKKKTTP